MRILRAVLVISLIVGSANMVFAGMRPSFYLEYSTWDATHIVVATEGEKIDGIFTIIESWKGDLKQGDIITISELSSFTSESSREIDTSWYRKDNVQPEYVTGSRMVLFLRKTIITTKKNNTEVAEILWTHATLYTKSNGVMFVSVVWIEQDRAYAFKQMMNPGSSTLSRLYLPYDSDEKGTSEGRLKERVMHILKIQESFNKVLTLSDLTKRAEALLSFTKAEQMFIIMAAFDELGKCGEDALPTLRAILADESLAERHGDALDALAIAGGIKVGPELTEILEKELVFWKEAEPNLAKEWWGQEPYTTRSNRARHTLYALEKIKFPACKKTVTEFCDFWRSSPKLENKSGLDQMSQACDKVLNVLNNK